MRQLPIFLNLTGRPILLIGEGPAADAKAALIERAGGLIVRGEDERARIAIVALDDPAEAAAAVARLRAKGVLVNAVDRPEHCDFTMPAIVDREPLTIAVGTGGASAGLASVLRERLEAIVPEGIGAFAAKLEAMKGDLRARFPDHGERRAEIARLLDESGLL